MGADKVERELEGTISVLHTAQRAKLLNRREVSDIVRKRRHHEYNLLRKNVSRTDYLHYAAFERELHLILKRRAKQRELTKLQVERTVDKTAARVNLIYSRAVHKFRFDDDLWLHYAKHCIKTGSTRAAARVFAKAIAFRNSSERIWLAAIAFHFDTNADTTGARTLAQRALRALPKSVKLWKEYFRLELCYLGKLVARRLAIGLRPDANEGNDQDPTLNPAENHGPTSNDILEEKISSGAADSGYETSDENNSNSDQKCASAPNTGATTTDDEHKELPMRVEEATASSESEEPIPGLVQGANGAAEQGLQRLTEVQDTIRNADGDHVDEESSSGEETDSSSSGAESSDEESMKPEVSSDEHEAYNASSLSFWEGGVPFAVFRNASNRLKLSHLDRAEFWDVAASTPFVPPQLLSHMLKFMKAESTESCLVQLIVIRMPWDIDRTTRKRSLGNKIGEDNGEIYLSESDQNALAAHAVNVTELLLTTVSSADFTGLSDSVASCVRSLLQGFRRLVSSTCSSKKFEDAMKEVVSVFEAHQAQIMLEVEKHETNEGTPQDDMNHWVLSKFEALLQQHSEGFNASAEFYEVLKQKVIVPFRSLEQDRLICLYLSKEKDISRMRSFTKTVLTLPPITMESLKAAINAELRILSESREGDPDVIPQIDQEMVSHTRKLFKRAIALPAAKRDVDLWLSYVDFERSVSRDTKEASTANWKATKVLLPSFQESFTERQTLRNLAQ